MLNQVQLQNTMTLRPTQGGSPQGNPEAGNAGTGLEQDQKLIPQQHAKLGAELGSAVRHPRQLSRVTPSPTLAQAARLTATLVIVGTAQHGFAAGADIFGGITTLGGDIKTQALAAIPIIAGCIAAIALLMYIFGNSKSKELFLKVAIIAGAAAPLVALIK